MVMYAEPIVMSAAESLAMRQMFNILVTPTGAMSVVNPVITPLGAQIAATAVGTAETALSVGASTTEIATLSASGLSLGPILIGGAIALGAGYMAYNYLNSDSAKIDVAPIPDKLSGLHRSTWVKESYPDPLPGTLPVLDPHKVLDVADYDNSMKAMADGHGIDDLANAIMDQYITRLHNSMLTVIPPIGTDHPVGTPSSIPIPNPTPNTYPPGVPNPNPNPTPAPNPTPRPIPKPGPPPELLEGLKTHLKKNAENYKSIPKPPSVSASQTADKLEKIAEAVGAASGSGGTPEECFPVKLCDETIIKLKEIVFGDKFTGDCIPVDLCSNTLTSLDTSIKATLPSQLIAALTIAIPLMVDYFTENAIRMDRLTELMDDLFKNPTGENIAQIFDKLKIRVYATSDSDGED